MSQEELAQKIGVSRQAVSKWERAEASPDTDNLILLARLYGVTLDELLTGAENAEYDKIKKQEAPAEQSLPAAERGEDRKEFSSESGGAKSEDFRASTKAGGIPMVSITSEESKSGIADIPADGTTVRMPADDENDGTDNEPYEKAVHDELPKGTANNKSKRKSLWYMLPYPIIVTIAFLIWGFCGGWSISWIVFLTIPLYYSLIDAIAKRRPSIFAFPVLIVAIYLLLGLWKGLWHPYWILFLMIPVYYVICEAFEKSNKN